MAHRNRLCLVSGCDLYGQPDKHGYCSVHYNDFKRVLDAEIQIIETAENNKIQSTLESTSRCTCPALIFPPECACISNNNLNCSRNETGYCSPNTKYKIFYCLYLYDIISTFLFMSYLFTLSDQCKQMGGNVDRCEADSHCFHGYNGCDSIGEISGIVGATIVWVFFRGAYEFIKAGCAMFMVCMSDEKAGAAFAFTLLTPLEWILKPGSLTSIAEALARGQHDDANMYIGAELLMVDIPAIGFTIWYASIVNDIDVLTALELIDGIIQLTLQCYQIRKNNSIINNDTS